jgi:catechol 2,3-dioxygenase-like lactoylglutathione lyase family enzyme
MTPGGLHHVELWVPDLTRARREWGWLLGQLGYEPFQDWDDGCSWRLRGTYLANTDGFEVELVAQPQR